MAASDRVTEVQDQNEWETVAEESGTPIDLSEVGSQFVGIYLGSELIAPEGWDEREYFTQHRFSDANGEIRTINEGAKLRDALKKVQPRAKVRITRTADVPMSDAGKNPMKDYRVEVAR